MFLTVLGEKEVLFDQEIEGINVSAIDGKVAIRNNHADYMTILQEGFVEIINEKQEKIYIKNKSLLFIEKNNIIIFS
jgi:F0F1-type ATP synthase epsilon subunit